MKRQSIDDGGWFDLDSAERYEEGSCWNGSNPISKATGSQWEHETLYLTRKGVYVLNHWSQWQGSGESWTAIGATAAVEWLVKNDHEVPPDERLQSALDESEL